MNETHKSEDNSSLLSPAMKVNHGSSDSHNSSTHSGSQSSSNSGNSGPIKISKYTEALINTWTSPPASPSVSPNRISVSQTVSFAAFLYEKMRNAVEFREEHLIRRAAIDRIIHRRMVLNENGRDIAEPLIKELLWARYYENNTIGEEKVSQLQSLIDKYFFLRNELGAGRSGKEQDKIATFMTDALSCEIQDVLSPDPKREAFINYAYQILRPQISSQNFESDWERDIQVYIAVEKTFAHSDASLIKYHLLKLMLPEITQITWKTADRVLPKLYDVFSVIEHQMDHPLVEKMRNTVKKHVAPFLILRDVFDQNGSEIGHILSNESELKYRVDEACRKRYDESGQKLRRMGIRSFIYILLTKVFIALLLEIPYDLYVMKQISYLPLIVNVIFPPALMALIIFTVVVPGDDNTKRIFQLIKTIVTVNPESPMLENAAVVVGKKTRNKGSMSNMVFSFLYSLMYLISFGSIIYVLSLLDFNPVSQLIFIFFVTLVTFFAFRVIQVTQEYQVVVHDTILTPIVDFYFLPIIRVGQWLSGEVLTRFNVLMFVLDFIIEMPFKAIVEVFDEWIRFVRLKKDEIV